MIGRLRAFNSNQCEHMCFRSLISLKTLIKLNIRVTYAMENRFWRDEPFHSVSALQRPLPSVGQVFQFSSYYKFHIHTLDVKGPLKLIHIKLLKLTKYRYKGCKDLRSKAVSL